MALTYIDGKEQMALEFCEKQLELENDPAKRKELKAVIINLKAKISHEKQDYLSQDNETITST